ncbi:hypothetical protein ACTUEL_22030, partial [Mucilaginibacter rubeus]
LQARSMVLAATRQVRILSRQARYKERIALIRTIPGVGEIRSYCWQVAPQQSLFPLLICKGKLRKHAHGLLSHLYIITLYNLLPRFLGLFAFL